MTMVENPFEHKKDTRIPSVFYAQIGTFSSHADEVSCRIRALKSSPTLL